MPVIFFINSYFSLRRFLTVALPLSPFSCYSFIDLIIFAALIFLIRCFLSIIYHHILSFVLLQSCVWFPRSDLFLSSILVFFLYIVFFLNLIIRVVLIIYSSIRYLHAFISIFNCLLPLGTLLYVYVCRSYNQYL